MKFTVTLFALLFAFSLSAQYQKGNLYLDGRTNASVQQAVGNRSVDIFGSAAYSAYSGYFVTNRLLVGSQVDFTSLSSENFPQINDTRLQLNPFLRYYFPGGAQRKVSYFGEAGFGTFKVFGSDNDFFETDFHFGAGAEMPLAKGVLGTATLRYNANASGLNFTTLDFGLNVLTGQLENAGNAITFSRGTLTADANFGSISYGRMSRNGMTDQESQIRFSPRIGYFFTDRLLIEGNVSTTFSSNRRFQNLTGTGFQETIINDTQLKFGLDVRYYLKKNGLFLPYLTAGVDYVNDRTRVVREVFDVDNRLQTSTAHWRAGAGCSYFLSPNLALDIEARFEKNNIQLNEFQAASSEGFKNLQLKTGFKFFLPR